MYVCVNIYIYIYTGNSAQQPEAAKRLVFRFLSQSPDAMDCFNPWPVWDFGCSQFVANWIPTKEDCSTALWIHLQPIYGWSHKAYSTREISMLWIYEFIPTWDSWWHLLINDKWWILNAWFYPNLFCSPFLWWAAWLRTLSLGIKFGWNHIEQFKGILPFARFQRLGVRISSLQWSFDVLKFYIRFGEQLVEGW